MRTSPVTAQRCTEVACGRVTRRLMLHRHSRYAEACPTQRRDDSCVRLPDHSRPHRDGRCTANGPSHRLRACGPFMAQEQQLSAPDSAPRSLRHSRVVLCPCSACTRFATTTTFGSDDVTAAKLRRSGSPAEWAGPAFAAPMSDVLSRLRGPDARDGALAASCECMVSCSHSSPHSAMRTARCALAGRPTTARQYTKKKVRLAGHPHIGRGQTDTHAQHAPVDSAKKTR